MIKGICERCGNEKEYKYPSHVKRFCSYSCSNAHKWESRKKGERTTLVCEVCKASFDLLASVLASRERRGRVRFCSHKCMGLANRKPGSRRTVRCDSCEKLFEKRADHVNERNYCSRECAIASRRLDSPLWSDAEYVRSYMRAYSENNRARLAAVARKWAANNKEKRLRIQARYRAANKGYLLQSARARRAKEKIGSFTHDDWLEIKERFDSKCLCCGKSEPAVRLEADHVVSIKSGGAHAPENIQPLCRSCNASKGARSIDFRTKQNLSIHGITVVEV